jgi:hypothetical protein
VLEGLPINQYREVEITVGANVGDNKPADKDAWPELPMPRDSHMLPEYSQQILRAARAGRIYRPPAPPEDDNEMKDEEEEVKEVQTGFTVKKYVKVARHLEVPEPEYLAKRRKGLPSQHAMNGVAAPVLRETKVKKFDAEGNALVYKVLVPEGQAVEGEVQPTDAALEVSPATAAPGTIVEGVGIVNAEGVVVANELLLQTPPRRRPPPPKKKRGGPGRKKRVIFAEGAAEHGTPSSTAGGDLLAVPGVKQEGGSVEPSDGDTPMADAGGDDDEGSGDDGSDEDDHDGQHASNPATPATAPTSAPNLDTVEITALESPVVAQEDSLQPIAKNEPSLPEPLSSSAAEIIEQSAGRDASSSPDLPLAVSHSRQNSLNQLSTSMATSEPEPMAIETTELVAEQVSPPEMAPMVPIEPEVTLAPPLEGTPALPLEVTPVPPLEVRPAPPLEVTPALPLEVTPAPPLEVRSAPPSEPDLMASLDRHLEKDSEDIAGS